jgi:uncharacterized protein YegL
MDNKKKGIGIFIAAIFVISVLAAMCAPASAAEKIDLFFLVDGSGSISSPDFQLQKEGLAYAINDSTVVPQDGRVSVCIIQFASTAQVEVPLTTITNQSVADAVSAGIMAISKLGGGTSMSGAFNMATANFPSDPSGRQVIDLSTDGSPNNPTATNLARDAALAAGFDDVNAIGVGLSPGSSGELFLQQLVYPQPWTSVPGFYILATDFQDFKDKIKEKIIKEIEPPTPSAVPAITPIGLIALVSLLSVVAAISIRKKMR